MSNATLRKVVTGFAAQDPSVIDHLINASGILESALAQPASHNAWHVGKKVSSLPSGTFINPGGSVTDTTVDDEIVQTDLKLCRILQSEPVEIADTYPGGKAAFFKNQYSAIIEGMGQTIAKQIIYGTDSTFGNVTGFTGFHQYAKANSKVIQCGGTTASRTTIFAVRWKNDICSLLFNPGMMSAGEFIKVNPVANGAAVSEVTNTTTGAKKLVYQYNYDAYIALLALASKNIAAMTQIEDADTDRPTATRINQLLDYVNASSSDTALYMNRTGRRLVYLLNDDNLVTHVDNVNYNNIVQTWNGIPIYLDENISSVETTVLD